MTTTALEPVLTIHAFARDHLGRPVVVIDADTYAMLETFKRDTWQEARGFGYGESARIGVDFLSPAGEPVRPLAEGMALAALHGIITTLEEETGHRAWIVSEGYTDGTLPRPSLPDVVRAGDLYFLAA